MVLVTAEGDPSGKLLSVTRTGRRLRAGETGWLKSLRPASEIGAICAQGGRLKVTNRVNQALVLAERYEGGILRTSRRSAWRAWPDQAQLLDDLRALNEAGIINQVGEDREVTGLEKRQASPTGVERLSELFARKRASAVTAAVTTSYKAAVTDSYSPLPLTGGEGAGRGG